MKSAKPYFYLAARAGRYAIEHLPDTESSFIESKLHQAAVCMWLQDMGENLSKVRKQFPDIYDQYATDDWHRLIGMRNIISHGYDSVDMKIVWDVSKHKLESLVQQFDELAASNQDF